MFAARRRAALNRKLDRFCQGLDNKDEAFEYLKSMVTNNNQVSIVNDKIEGIFDLPVSMDMPVIRSIAAHTFLEERLGRSIPHRVFNTFAITGTDEEVDRLIGWMTSQPDLMRTLQENTQLGFGYFLKLSSPTDMVRTIFNTFIAKDTGGKYLLSTKALMNHFIPN